MVELRNEHKRTGDTMTLKDYAVSRGITYEAVRQLVKKLEPEITSHITKHGRTRVIDPDGVQLLDDRRKGNRISVTSSEARTEHQNASQTIDQLKNEVILLQRQLLEARTEVLEARESVARLEAYSDICKSQETKIERLEGELGRYHRTVFGLYRKDKE